MSDYFIRKSKSRIYKSIRINVPIQLRLIELNELGNGRKANNNCMPTSATLLENYLVITLNLTNSIHPRSTLRPTVPLAGPVINEVRLCRRAAA